MHFMGENITPLQTERTRGRDHGITVVFEERRHVISAIYERSCDSLIYERICHDLGGSLVSFLISSRVIVLLHV